MTPEFLIQMGTKIAKYTDIKKARVSAIAFTKNGNIITYAQNRKIIGSKNRFSIHAEEALIRKLVKIGAFQRYKNIIIFVMRISSDGVSMARPCKKCAKLLSKYDVDVIYTSWDGQITNWSD